MKSEEGQKWTRKIMSVCTRASILTKEGVLRMVEHVIEDLKSKRYSNVIKALRGYQSTVLPL